MSKRKTYLEWVEHEKKAKKEFYRKLDKIRAENIVRSTMPKIVRDILKTDKETKIK